MFEIYSRDLCNLRIQPVLYHNRWLRVFDLFVSVEGFNGGYRFSIEETSMEKFEKIINEISQKLEGQVKLFDDDSDSFISFTCKSLGHVDINGQLGASGDQAVLKFRIEADQTVFDKINFLLRETV